MSMVIWIIVGIVVLCGLVGITGAIVGLVEQAEIRGWHAGATKCRPRVTNGGNNIA